MTSNGNGQNEINWLQRLCKWRSVLVGRILGTRPLTDSQTKGMRDLFDKLNILKAEGRATASILVEREVITQAEFNERIRATLASQKEGVEDIFEDTLLIRAHFTVISGILLEQGIITVDDYRARINKEARWLCEQYEKEFPGFSAHDFGINISMPEAAETTKGWPH